MDEAWRIQLLHLSRAHGLRFTLARGRQDASRHISRRRRHQKRRARGHARALRSAARRNQEEPPASARRCVAEHRASIAGSLARCIGEGSRESDIHARGERDQEHQEDRELERWRHLEILDTRTAGEYQREGWRLSLPCSLVHKTSWIGK
jgi:hypothetical protein